MRAVWAVLADRRRSQRGSVLSGVLIITAFLAIIVGALMTELSTNFLLSNTLSNRVTNEATVNSAMELAFNQLQGTTLNAPCPSLSSLALNGTTAGVGYVSCWPTVDRRSPQFVSVATSSAFSLDGMHSVIQGNGQDLYVVGDSAGTVYQFAYGRSTPNWSLGLGAPITGPVLVMPDVTSNPPDVITLVPISTQAPGCNANACVELLGQDVGSAPDVFCFMAANATVTVRPAAGLAFPRLTYFGDQSGWLYAYDATERGNCARKAIIQVPSGDPVMAGPIVLRNTNGNTDEVYVVTGTNSVHFLHYTYSSGSFTLADNVSIAADDPVGLALEPTAVPARVAVTLAGGTVAMIRIDSAYHPSVQQQIRLGTALAAAPYWCQCPTGPLIGVGGVNGTLYLRDTNLAGVASFATGSSIRTTPGVDGAGNWYVAADNGSLYEVQLQAGQLTLAVAFGSAGAPIRSSPVVAGCPTGICVYLGSANSHAYLVPLDARDAVLTACIAAPPPACSGANPRLWASAEVGVAGSPTTVHVQGWSYYSP